MAENALKVMSVADLKGRFRISSYQRGYRWERRQVEQLLDDIVNSDNNAPYYLQPIVVSPAPETVNDLPECERYDYDIIDGQQRLTTLYIILKALDYGKRKEAESAIKIMLEDIDIEINYSISYETRTATREFLDDICQLDTTVDKDRILENPDHLYMWHAYSIVEQWIGKNKKNLIKLTQALTSDEHHTNLAKVIWYERTAIDNWKKFTELNIGKIPLTNSELVKALLMRSEKNDITEEQKSTIIQQWDQIERELGDPNFWGFLTARKSEQYDTKIDLLFEILTQKPQNSKDDFFTFNYYDKLFSNHNADKGKEKWNKIYLQYQQLRDWYLNRDLYHKIGYLSTTDKSETLYQELIAFITHMDETTNTRPSNRQFRELLEKKIIDSIKLPDDVYKIEDLCYLTNENSTHHQTCIHRILTLYNVLYTQNYTRDRYDFHAHKDSQWTLEHIHAQNSESLSKTYQQREWVKSHLESLMRYLELPGIGEEKRKQLESLAEEMKKYIPEDSGITVKIFNDIASIYSELIVSANDEKATRGEYEHQLDNMALLSHNENAAFNNSTFDVKRHKMLKDMSATHIPVCTQRVFLKSIPDANDNHPYFWGTIDREAYIKDIRNVLGDYLDKIEKPAPQLTDSASIENEQ